MNVILVVLICFSVFSCNGRDVSSPRGYSRSIERVRLEPVLVAEALVTNFPSAMKVYNDYIIVLNPFLRDGFLSIYDRHTGKELNTVGTLGRGPGESIQPYIGNIYEDKLLIFELGANRKALIVIDSLLALKFNPIRYSDSPIQDFIYRTIKIDNGLFVSSVFDDWRQPFKVHNESSVIKYFGKPPIRNTNDFPQGGTEYHVRKQQIFFYNSRNPYIACYQRFDDNSFTLNWENQFIKPRYSIYNDKISWREEQSSGIMGIAFTNKYIVCLRNELKLREIRGRETSTAPRSLYLFDYQGNLVKIVDLIDPSIRIASEEDSDIVYILSVEPDFNIVKYDLSEI